MRTVRRIVPLAALAAAAMITTPAHAAGAVMTLTKVAYDPVTGPSDPACKASLPGLDGKGAGNYEPADGSHTVRFEWSVPATMSPGIGGFTKVTVNANQASGYSGAIALKPALEFGPNAGARQQIIATVPVGQTGTASDEEIYTFTPSREFVAGEHLYIRIEIGCANFIYEYTGSEAPSACPGGTRTTAVIAACKEKEVATPLPGGSARVTGPLGRVTVSSSFGSLSGSTVVANGGRARERGQKIGEAVATCWLLGPDALPLPTNPEFVDWYKQNNVLESWKKADDPAEAMKICTSLVVFLAQDADSQRRAHRAAAGCSSQHLAIRGQMRKGKVVSLKLVKAKPKVRYACQSAGGALRITPKGKLRKHLGPKLDLGVVRHPNAPADGSRLTFGFG